MSEETRRTIAGWVHELERPDAQLTLEELTVLVLVHIREHTLDTRRRTEHSEAILASLDLFCAHLAHRMDLPYDTRALPGGTDG